jgi:hypothetical protein
MAGRRFLCYPNNFNKTLLAPTDDAPDDSGFRRLGDVQTLGIVPLRTGSGSGGDFNVLYSALEMEDVFVVGSAFEERDSGLTEFKLTSHPIRWYCAWMA